MESTFERNYNLEIGDVVLVVHPGWGFAPEDVGKYVEVISKPPHAPCGCRVAPYNSAFSYGDVDRYVAYESFGENPMVLLNNKEEKEETPVECELDWYDENKIKDTYTTDHYNLYYTLTENDIEAGKIKVDAYWVAKQWKTGSRDDSGALWHSLKTIARFGEKNDKAREIKALYNQAKALARIYDVEL